ncbi:MAG: hypothetical protein WAV50_00825 [Minisyncoccia bacterium]
MDISKFTELLKENSLFKEALYLSLGLVFIFVTNIIFYIDVNKIPNYEDFKSIFGIILILPISYFLGRISYEVGYVINFTTVFLLKGEWRKEIKSGFDGYVKYIKSDSYTPSARDVQMRSTSEAIEEFKDSTYIKSRFEESRRDLLISYAFSGFFLFTIIVSIFIHSRLSIEYLLVLELILIIKAGFNDYTYNTEGRKLVAMAVRKERQKS